MLLARRFQVPQDSVSPPPCDSCLSPYKQACFRISHLHRGLPPPLPPLSLFPLWPHSSRLGHSAPLLLASHSLPSPLHRGILPTFRGTVSSAPSGCPHCHGHRQVLFTWLSPPRNHASLRGPHLLPVQNHWLNQCYFLWPPHLTSEPPYVFGGTLTPPYEFDGRPSGLTVATENARCFSS